MHAFPTTPPPLHPTFCPPMPHTPHCPSMASFQSHWVYTHSCLLTFPHPPSLPLDHTLVGRACPQFNRFILSVRTSASWSVVQPLITSLWVTPSWPPHTPSPPFPTHPITTHTFTYTLHTPLPVPPTPIHKHTRYMGPFHTRFTLNSTTCWIGGQGGLLDGMPWRRAP